MYKGYELEKVCNGEEKPLYVLFCLRNIVFLHAKQNNQYENSTSPI